MRTKSLALLFVVALTVVVAVFAQQPQNPLPAAQVPAAKPAEQQQIQKSPGTIPITVNLVDVLFTVLDRRDKLVSGL